MLKEISDDFVVIRGMGVSKRVFRSKRMGMVVKRPYLTGKKLTKCQAKYLIPTITFTNNEGNCPWFVQPLCKVTNNASARAYRFFNNKKGLCFGDLHEGNVGIYRGKPVIFDY